MNKLLTNWLQWNPRERKIIGWAALLAAVLLMIDQVTKMLVSHYMTLGEHIVIIPGCFDLTYITNKGAAWGIMHGQTFILLGIGVVVTVAMLLFMRWLTEGWTERYWALFIILSGIFGNSIDRIWRGEVVDFLDFYFRRTHWPAFNVADICICVGLGIYFLSVFRRPSRKHEHES